MNFNELSAAETYTAQAFVKAVTRCNEASEKLVEAFGEIDISEENVERIFLDIEKKGGIIGTMDYLDSLARNLETSILIPLLLIVLAKNREVQNDA